MALYIIYGLSREKVRAYRTQGRFLLYNALPIRLSNRPIWFGVYRTVYHGKVCLVCSSMPVYVLCYIFATFESPNI